MNINSLLLFLREIKEKDDFRFLSEVTENVLIIQEYIKKAFINNNPSIKLASNTNVDSNRFLTDNNEYTLDDYLCALLIETTSINGDYTRNNFLVINKVM